LLHGHQQRFDRLAYASMLRLEIKKEVTDNAIGRTMFPLLTLTHWYVNLVPL
jgi:hypothetical protein